MRRATPRCSWLCISLLAGDRRAIFLILEMDSPFDGFIAISSKPMRNALHYLNT